MSDRRGREAFPDAPEHVFYRIPGSCRGEPDFDACFQGLERVDIKQRIRIGTYAEDNPSPRAKHHFHDPEREHAPPSARARAPRAPERRTARG